MKNLKQLLSRPLQRVPNSLVFALLVVAILGFADAAYLTVEHYQNAIPPCSIGSCETVLSSDYSVVFGIPVALGGMVYYLLISAGVFAYLESKNEKIFRYTLIATTLGLLATVWFLFVQSKILNAYCIYCLGSAVTSTLLFILAIYILRKYGISSLQNNNVLNSQI